jgi:hypothetical protein
MEYSKPATPALKAECHGLADLPYQEEACSTHAFRIEEGGSSYLFLSFPIACSGILIPLPYAELVFRPSVSFCEPKSSIFSIL